MKNRIEMYGNKVFGVEVSEYGLEYGRLDYRTLSKIIDNCISNNTVRDRTMTDWKIVAGEFDKMVCQDFIISRYGYEILAKYTDELVFYNEELDLYIWAVTHYGTSWDYVLTNVELVQQ